jgi:hypothetical protein
MFWKQKAPRVTKKGPWKDGDLELRKFYVEQRDKHLDQLMSINGRLAFGGLAAVLAVAVGVDNFQEARLDLKATPCWVIAVFAAGGILIAIATWAISSHHSARIRSLEEKIVTTPRELDASDYEIIPPHARPWPFQCIFFGLLLMGLAVLAQLLPKDPPIPARPAVESPQVSPASGKGTGPN